LSQSRYFWLNGRQMGRPNEKTLPNRHKKNNRPAQPQRLRRSIFGIAALFAFLVFSVSPSVAKYASFVIDAESGQVLHQANADTRNYPASLTKMMTLYLVFEALHEKKWSLNKRLKVSARAARQPASKLALKRGTTIRVRDAILALVTKSANDVASVIAEGMSGSERNFGLKMTAKARKLGMSRTTFRNASGLPNRAQLSTARDMGTLARALIRDYPQYYHYFSTESFRYGGLTHKNHNKLLKSYSGADGIKTGYIRASGFNLVASVERDDRRLIGVVFGGKSSGSRNRHMTSLLDKGFQAVLGQPATQVAKSSPRKKSATPKKVVRAKTPAKAKTSRPVPDGDYAVQVGAYRYKSPAIAIARKAIAYVPSYLSDGIIKIVPLRKKKRRPLYRARIAGLEKKAAFRACYALEKKGMDCLVVVMKNLQVASLP
jgi:D-alanyl-D-alanine carboxypeptidase